MPQICLAPKCPIHFTPNKPFQIYCSSRCASRAEYHRNRERHLEQKKAHYRRNGRSLREKQTKYRLARPCTYNISSNEWHKRNRERGSRSSHLRRVRRCTTSALEALTPTEWTTILQIWEYSCAYCGTQGEMTKDHVTPLSKGGQHTASNIVPACKACNSSKGARDVTEFIKKGRAA